MARPRSGENDAMRRHVLSLLRRGLVSLTEAARIGRVDKATVWRWCQKARPRIDPEMARSARIAAMMTVAERISAGNGVRDEAERIVHPRTGPSKATLRKQAEWAMMASHHKKDPGL